MIGMELIDEMGDGLILVLDKKLIGPEQESVLCAIIAERVNPFCIYDRKISTPWDLTRPRPYGTLEQAYKEYARQGNP